MHGAGKTPLVWLAILEKILGGGVVGVYANCQSDNTSQLKFG